MGKLSFQSLKDSSLSMKQARNISLLLNSNIPIIEGKNNFIVIDDPRAINNALFFAVNTLSKLSEKEDKAKPVFFISFNRNIENLRGMIFNLSSITNEIQFANIQPDEFNVVEYEKYIEPSIICYDLVNAPFTECSYIIKKSNQHKFLCSTEESTKIFILCRDVYNKLVELDSDSESVFGLNLKYSFKQNKEDKMFSIVDLDNLFAPFSFDIQDDKIIPRKAISPTFEVINEIHDIDQKKLEPVSSTNITNKSISDSILDCKPSDLEVDLSNINGIAFSAAENSLPIFMARMKFKNSDIEQEFQKNGNEVTFQILQTNGHHVNVTIKDFLLSQKHKDFLDLILVNGTISKCENNELFSDDEFYSISFNPSIFDENQQKELKNVLSEISRAKISIGFDNSPEDNILDTTIGSLDLSSLKNDSFRYMINQKYLQFLDFSSKVAITKEQVNILVNKIDNYLIKAIVRYVIANDGKSFHRLEDIIRKLQILKYNSLRPSTEIISSIIDYQDIFKDLGIEIEIVDYGDRTKGSSKKEIFLRSNSENKLNPALLEINIL